MFRTIGEFFADPLVQSLSVAIVSGALAGLISPIVKGRIDGRTAERQKRLEAVLARQSRIIDAQADLLRETADALWSIRMHMLKVAYYWRENQQDKALAAWQQYDERAWDLFARFRTEISRAARVSTTSAHDTLRNLYYNTLIPVDENLGKMHQDQLAGRNPSWGSFYDDLFGAISDKIEAALLALGKELHLSA